MLRIFCLIALLSISGCSTVERKPDAEVVWTKTGVKIYTKKPCKIDEDNADGRKVLYDSNKPSLLRTITEALVVQAAATRRVQ